MERRDRVTTAVLHALVLVVMAASTGCEILAALGGGAGLACRDDQACPSGLICLDRSCRSPSTCSNDDDCAAMHGVCRDGACVVSADAGPADVTGRTDTNAPGDGARDAGARDHRADDASMGDGPPTDAGPTIPTITGTTPGSRCGTGTVVLGATASAGTINWYAAATGGASLGTGTSFTTPSIAATTTYYVDATSGGYTTASRTAVTATVYLAGWTYRRPVTVTNGGAALPDYQVLVTVDTASMIAAAKMRSDCGDVRFTDSDRTTSISDYLESGCNTASTKFWTKVPSIPPESTTVYLYYGNPGATSQSDGNATFLFFDDFNSGTTPNASKWLTGCRGTSNTGAGNTLESGMLRVAARSTGYASQSQCWTRTSNTFNLAGGLYIQYTAEPYQSAGEGQWWRAGFHLSSTATPPLDSGTPRVAPSILIAQSQSEYSTGGAGLEISAGIDAASYTSLFWNSGNSPSYPGTYTFKLIVDGSRVTVYRDDTKHVDNALHEQVDLDKYIYFYRPADQDILAYQRFDNVFVAKRASPDPTTVMGSEEAL